MSTAQEKGDALEAAVAAIEELILQASPASAAKPVVEKKKILQIGGVRHEIDIYVTIPSAVGYESIYIFECKNWQDAVGKNEIIVFSEKIDASKASRGYFVAKAFTSDAEAQAKKDSRLVLLIATEHDPTVPSAVQFFSRFPQFTKVQMNVSVRGSKGLKSANFKCADVRAKYLGNDIDLCQQADLWCKEACNEDVARFNSEIVPEGIYDKVMEVERDFLPGDLTVNELDIERVKLRIEYNITVKKSEMISHFEIESRGRFFRFAPMATGGATIEGFVAFSVFPEHRPNV